MGQIPVIAETITNSPFCCCKGRLGPVETHKKYDTEQKEEQTISDLLQKTSLDRSSSSSEKNVEIDLISHLSNEDHFSKNIKSEKVESPKKRPIPILIVM
jgi:hypothetical protein